MPNVLWLRFSPYGLVKTFEATQDEDGNEGHAILVKSNPTFQERLSALIAFLKNDPIPPWNREEGMKIRYMYYNTWTDGTPLVSHSSDYAPLLKDCIVVV